MGENTIDNCYLTRNYFLNIFYLGDKTIDFEARILEDDKTLHLGDLDIVPLFNNRVEFSVIYKKLKIFFSVTRELRYSFPVRVITLIFTRRYPYSSVITFLKFYA